LRPADERDEHPDPAMRTIERYVLKQRRREAPDASRAASPLHLVHADARPTFCVHGDIDTIIPEAQGRAFAQRLREVSHHPVLYAKIPGGHHAFDVVPSSRTIVVVAAAERFLARVW